MSWSLADHERPLGTLVIANDSDLTDAGRQVVVRHSALAAADGGHGARRGRGRAPGRPSHAVPAPALVRGTVSYLTRAPRPDPRTALFLWPDSSRCPLNCARGMLDGGRGPLRPRESWALSSSGSTWRRRPASLLPPRVRASFAAAAHANAIESRRRARQRTSGRKSPDRARIADRRKHRSGREDRRQQRRRGGGRLAIGEDDHELHIRTPAPDGLRRSSHADVGTNQ